MSQKVSVILPIYNERIKWVTESILSIEKQTYKNIELFIISDTNDSKINKHLAYLKNRYTNIKIIYNKENMGLVYSLNKAMTYVTGDIIARMDADDISHPNRIEREINFLNEKQVDLVSTQANLIDENDKVYRRIPKKDMNSRLTEQLLKKNNILCHPTWLLKKELFKSINSYREINFAEDYDFSLRALEAGFKIGIMGEVLLDYRVRKNSISRKHTLEQFLVDEKIRNAFSKKQLTNHNVEQFNIKISKIEAEKFSKLDNELTNLLNWVPKKDWKHLSTIIMLAKIMLNKYFRRKFISLLNFKITERKLKRKITEYS
ncbi:putative glycosyltransferase EpsE [Melissococcus plutonius]|uniref:glycosyltransferase family 2 protein n=1 Tax=Melissococcus plutonius TaxID=33970 RepID=UPI00065E0B6D|nr:glycosyltransferase [Melissococcus plutonius]KMT27404.1 putative glycosyltransferase EpsE [Melissococcus plutonius]KMT27577.1 putative glycosyltransferase EpsE [Melissococcus plutonius]